MGQGGRKRAKGDPGIWSTSHLPKTHPVAPFSDPNSRGIRVSQPQCVHHFLHPVLSKACKRIRGSSPPARERSWPQPQQQMVHFFPGNSNFWLCALSPRPPPPHPPVLCVVSRGPWQGPMILLGGGGGRLKSCILCLRALGLGLELGGRERGEGGWGSRTRRWLRVGKPGFESSFFSA